jgi:two-component system sensor histidine kinase DegS
MTSGESGHSNPWVLFEQKIDAETEQARRSLVEVSLMLEQSQAELSRLTQRNAAINNHLQQVQNQIETLPRAEIRSVYNAALDIQHRLLMMRGQLDKLQSDQDHLQRLLEILDQSKKLIGQHKGSGFDAQKNGSETLEMVIEGQEAVRKRLSQQMHDGPAQALSNFVLQVDITSRLFDLDPVRAKEELANMKTAAMATFQKVRAFITELRPMMLDDLGLVPTLKRYVDSYREQSGHEIALSVVGQERRMEPYLEIMLFRAAQELVGNAVRHNLDQPGRPQINVQLDLDNDLVKVVVVDNGKGMNPEAALASGGLGLKLIHERVEMLGGKMTIDSLPGHGCKVSFQVPALEVRGARVIQS